MTPAEMLARATPDDLEIWGEMALDAATETPSPDWEQGLLALAALARAVAKAERLERAGHVLAKEHATIPAALLALRAAPSVRPNIGVAVQMLLPVEDGFVRIDRESAAQIVALATGGE